MVRALPKTIGFTAFVISAWVAWVATAGGYDQPAGFHREIRWESSASSARGILLWEHSAPGAVKRVLIETPGGRHLVLTKALFVRAGVKREEILDVETGWKSELTRRSEFRAATLSDYFDRVFDEHVPGPGKEIELGLQTSNGIDYSATVPMESQPSAEYAAFAGLLREHLDEDSPRPFPAGVREALAFLNAAFERSGSDSRGIIEILSKAFNPSAVGADTSWRQIDGRIHNGLGLEDPGLVAFASRFSSVDPEAPLPSGTVEVLAQDQKWTAPPGR